MKKILSVIVLVLCAIASIVVITFTSILLIGIIELIYAKSRALFWVILLCRGTFGLWIFWVIVPLAADLTVRFSQNASLSKKGLRYTVTGIFLVVFYALSLIGVLRNYQQYDVLPKVFSYIVILLYSVTLIIHGRETAQLEYVHPQELTSQYSSQMQQARIQSSDNDIPTESLKALKELHDTGVISEEEFNEKKKQLLRL